MAATPLPLPLRFPALGLPSPPRRPTAAHLLTVASALRVGQSLHLHLHLLLSSPFQDSYQSDYLAIIKELWYDGPNLSKESFCLERLADALARSYSSCFSYFSSKHSGKEFGGKRNKQFEASKGFSSNRRLWSNTLLALNVLVYITQIATHGKLLLWGAKINSLIAKGQLWRLATCSFLHANIGHLMVNCYSLNSIGPAMEQLSGSKRFLAVYFASAISSSLMSYRFCQFPAVGASGAIFGLVGASAVFALRHRNLFGGYKQELRQIAHVVAINMIIGFLSSGVDNWGHLGGLLGGAAISWFLGPEWRYQSRAADGRLIFADNAPIFRLINRRSS